MASSILERYAWSFVTILLVYGALMVQLSVRYWEEVHPDCYVSALGNLKYQVFLHTDTAVPLLPPIYWINLDTSIQRRLIMENMFAQLQSQQPESTVVRVTAHDAERIKSLQEKNLLRLENGVSLIGKRYVYGSSFMNHVFNRYDYQEAACLISHLDAIRQAYEAGHEVALILEDDARLTSVFLKYWKDSVDLAPDDWTVLQYGTINPTVVKQMSNFTNGDPWISWQPDHWSTRAYLINREGMQRILDRTHSYDSNLQENAWTLKGESVLVADEVVYYMAETTYTSTYPPFVDTFDVSSTIQAENDHSGLAALNSEFPSKPTLEIPSREESVLVLSHLPIHESVAEALKDLERLRLDAISLCSMHPSKCDWHVQMILGSTSILDDADFSKARSTLPPNVHVHIRLGTQISREDSELKLPQEHQQHWNPFAFSADFIHQMKEYDLVLFKENHQRITGFPWNSFLEGKGDAVVAGPLRQAVRESLLSKFQESKPQQYPMFDAQEWKLETWRAPWSGLFESVSPTKVPYLETFFVLMDGDFASWFFAQSLLPEFLAQEPIQATTVPPTSAKGRAASNTLRWSGGPDLMWCGAAKEWNPSKPSCHLVPVVSKLEDSLLEDEDDKDKTSHKAPSAASTPVEEPANRAASSPSRVLALESSLRKPAAATTGAVSLAVDTVAWFKDYRGSGEDDDTSSNNNGAAAIDEDVHKFERWMKTSEPWQTAIEGYTLIPIQAMCKGALISFPSFELEECIDRVVSIKQIQNYPAALWKRIFGG